MVWNICLKTFKKYFSDHGIFHQTSCVYTQQNSLEERKNRYLLEATRLLMIAFNVPKLF